MLRCAETLFCRELRWNPSWPNCPKPCNPSRLCLMKFHFLPCEKGTNKWYPKKKHEWWVRPARWPISRPSPCRRVHFAHPPLKTGRSFRRFSPSMAPFGSKLFPSSAADGYADSEALRFKHWQRPFRRRLKALGKDLGRQSCEKLITRSRTMSLQAGNGWDLEKMIYVGDGNLWKRTKFEGICQKSINPWSNLGKSFFFFFEIDVSSRRF